MRIAFDFDDTLCVNGKPNEVVVELLNRNLDAGHDCFVITSRNQEHEERNWWSIHDPKRVLVAPMMKELKLFIPVEFTNHVPKAAYMVKAGIFRLYDNDDAELRAVRLASLQAVEVNSWLGITGPGICKSCGEELFTSGVHRSRLSVCCSICGYKV